MFDFKDKELRKEFEYFKENIEYFKDSIITCDECGTIIFSTIDEEFDDDILTMIPIVNNSYIHTDRPIFHMTRDIQ